MEYSIYSKKYVQVLICKISECYPFGNMLLADVTSQNVTKEVEVGTSSTVTGVLKRKTTKTKHAHGRDGHVTMETEVRVVCAQERHSQNAGKHWQTSKARMDSLWVSEKT